MNEDDSVTYDLMYRQDGVLIIFVKSCYCLPITPVLSDLMKLAAKVKSLDISKYTTIAILLLTTNYNYSQLFDHFGFFIALLVHFVTC